MITKLSEKLTDYFILKNIIDIGEKETYCYCFELMIAFIFNLSLAIIIGFSFLQFVPTILFIIVFLSLRTFAGGYHAKTHFRCILIFVVVFTSFIIIIKWCDNFSITNLILSVLGTILLLIFAPLDCKENRVDKKRKRKLKIYTSTFAITYTAIVIVLNIFNYDKIAFSIAYPLAAVALSVTYAKIIKQ